MMLGLDKANFFNKSVLYLCTCEVREGHASEHESQYFSGAQQLAAHKSPQCGSSGSVLAACKSLECSSTVSKSPAAGCTGSVLAESELPR